MQRMFEVVGAEKELGMNCERFGKKSGTNIKKWKEPVRN